MYVPTKVHFLMIPVVDIPILIMLSFTFEFNTSFGCVDLVPQILLKMNDSVILGDFLSSFGG